jgi:hypothetical protein
MPSIAHGVASFLWGLGLGLFVWIGLKAVGVSSATAVLLGLLSFGAIFLFVRLYGEDDVRQPTRSRDRMR